MPLYEFQCKYCGVVFGVHLEKGEALGEIYCVECKGEDLTFEGYSYHDRPMFLDILKRIDDLELWRRRVMIELDLAEKDLEEIDPEKSH